MRCHLHHEREATEICLSCDAALCGECALVDDGHAQCARCFTHGRHLGRDGRRWFVLLIGAALVSAVVWGWATHRASVEEAKLYGSHADEIMRLRVLWERTPCHRETAEQLVDLMLAAGDGENALEVAEHLAMECPASLPSHTLLFAIRHRLGETRGAVDAANRIIELAPWRPEGYAYRGLAHEAAGDLTAATEDFSEAIALSPRLMDVPMNLANVLERRGRYCEAAEPLVGALSFYPGLDNRFDIERRIERLRRRGRCISERLDAGEVRVPFDRSDEVIVLDARVNGEHPARFIVDTGASSVVVSRALADRLGIESAAKSAAVYVQTAGGVVDAYPAELKEVRIDGAAVSNLPVLVCDTMGQEVDGLLGINFLNRFQVAIDHQDGFVSFKPRTDPSDAPTPSASAAQPSPSGESNPRSGATAAVAR